jgi:hypothetical protein
MRRIDDHRQMRALLRDHHRGRDRYCASTARCGRRAAEDHLVVAPSSRYSAARSPLPASRPGLRGTTGGAGVPARVAKFAAPRADLRGATPSKAGRSPSSTSVTAARPCAPAASRAAGRPRRRALEAVRAGPRQRRLLAARGARRRHGCRVADLRRSPPHGLAILKGGPPRPGRAEPTRSSGLRSRRTRQGRRSSGGPFGARSEWNLLHQSFQNVLKQVWYSGPRSVGQPRESAHGVGPDSQAASRRGVRRSRPRARGAAGHLLVAPRGVAPRRRLRRGGDPRRNVAARGPVRPRDAFRSPSPSAWAVAGRSGVLRQPRAGLGGLPGRAVQAPFAAQLEHRPAPLPRGLRRGRAAASRRRTRPSGQGQRIRGTR